MEDVNNNMNRELKFDNLTENEFELIYQACGFSYNFLNPHTNITKDEKGRVTCVKFEEDARNAFQLYKIGKPCESIEIQYTDDTHFICTIRCSDKTVYKKRYFITTIYDSRYWLANINMAVYGNETIKIIIQVSETFVNNELTRVDVYNSKSYSFYNYIEKSIFYLKDKVVVNIYKPPTYLGFVNVSRSVQNNNPIKETQIYYNNENTSIDFSKPDITLSNTDDITTLNVKTRKNKSEISLLDLLDKYYRD